MRVECCAAYLMVEGLPSRVMLTFVRINVPNNTSSQKVRAERATRRPVRSDGSRGGMIVEVVVVVAMEEGVMVAVCGVCGGGGGRVEEEGCRHGENATAETHIATRSAHPAG